MLRDIARAGPLNRPPASSARCAATVCGAGVYFLLRHPHILTMAQWQKPSTREPPKTKAELREMLTEAVRNTQPEPERPPKASKDRGEKRAYSVE